MAEGVLSFLFDGRPPPSVTTYGTTTNNVPQWLSDYTQAVINKGNVVASQPYMSYEGPRLAGFSPEQEAAFSLTEQNIGKFKPLLDQSMGTTQGVLGSISGMIAPNLQGASRTFPQEAGKYMNPYVENVTKRAQSLANRNFEEVLLPQIQDIFTRSGQYGSTRMADTVLRGARDVSEGLQEAADASLAQAYTTAGQQFASDAGRQGNLAQLGIEAGFEGSGVLAKLAEQIQRQGIADASALETIGRNRQADAQANLDLAYDDFVRQRDYPKQQVEWMSNLIRGIPQSSIPSATTTSTTKPYEGEMQKGLVGSLGSLLSLWKAISEDSGD